LTSVLVSLLSISIGSHASAQVLEEKFWVPNGPVRAIIQSGTSVYLGGDFTRVGPATGSAVAMDASTGALLPDFPKVAGVVNTVVPDGADGWYLGGAFQAVGGVARSNVAHILADMSVSPWAPNPDTELFAIGVTDSTVYLSGDPGLFAGRGGSPIQAVGAVHAVTGDVLSWNPGPNGPVLTFAVLDATVLLGGAFTSVGGNLRTGLVLVDAETGAILPWDSGSDGSVSSLVVSGSTVYTGGEFQNIGGQTRSCFAAFDRATLQLSPWDPNAGFPGFRTGTVQAVSGSAVYVTGPFSSIGGQTRQYHAEVDAVSGLATTWYLGHGVQIEKLAVSDGGVYASGEYQLLSGKTGDFLLVLDPLTGAEMAATLGLPNDEVRALASSGPVVLMGGAFTSVGGVTRSGIAALDLTTGQATAWDPAPGQTFVPPRINGIALLGSTVYLAGSFDTMGGQPRIGLAAVDAVTATPTPWDPGLNAPIDLIATHGSTIYVSGYFTALVRGEFRSNLAAFDPITAYPTAWDPDPDSRAHALAFSGSTIYVGGVFTSIGGQARQYLAEVDAVTGVATSWDPHPDSGVLTMALLGSEIYVGGEFSSVGGQSRGYLACLDPNTGQATAWAPQSNGTVSALASGTMLYAGGLFSDIAGNPRRGLAAIDPSTALADAWNPEAPGTISTIVATGAKIFVGGEFLRVGTAARAHFAVFQAATTSISVALIDSHAEQGRVRLEWRAPGTPVDAILERRTRDHAWEQIARPVPDSSDRIVYEDTDVLPGVLYGYRLTVFDPAGDPTQLETWIRVPEGERAPGSLRLEMTGPNPSSGPVIFRYGLPLPGRAWLRMFDVHGRRVATVVDRMSPAGWRSVTWDGRDDAGQSVASGVYYAELYGDGTRHVRKIAIVR
jgi:hypothetical protein